MVYLATWELHHICQMGGLKRTATTQTHSHTQQAKVLTSQWSSAREPGNVWHRMVTTRKPKFNFQNYELSNHDGVGKRFGTWVRVPGIPVGSVLPEKPDVPPNLLCLDNSQGPMTVPNR